MQIAGSRCGACDQNVGIIRDGSARAKCGVVYHKACLEDSHCPRCGQALLSGEEAHSVPSHREQVRTASPASELVAPELPSSSNALLRLWRGEFSLRDTYWGWGVAGGIVWAGILSITLANRSLGAWRVLSVLHVGYSVVVWVAVWRSANRYTGPRVWGVLAKVSVALSILGSISR